MRHPRGNRQDGPGSGAGGLKVVALVAFVLCGAIILQQSGEVRTDHNPLRSVSQQAMARMMRKRWPPAHAGMPGVAVGEPVASVQPVQPTVVTPSRPVEATVQPADAGAVATPVHATPAPQVHAGTADPSASGRTDHLTPAATTWGPTSLAGSDDSVTSTHVPSLTVGFCRRHAVQNSLITTAVDQKYMIWGRNWAKALQANGVTNLFIGAMDAEALRLSEAEGIPAVALGQMRQGTSWHSANRYKIRLVQGVVELGFDVLFTDGDVTFIRDPMPFLFKYPDAGVLISTDLLIREKPFPMKNGLENTYEIYTKQRADLNVGIMFVRATRHTERMVNHWAEISNADMAKSMQTFFVSLVRELAWCQPNPQHEELSNCYNGTVPVGLLPMDLFAGGYIFFVERLPQRDNLPVISVHATYQVHQGLDGKRERLRHAHLWFLDGDDYFQPAGGLLTMAPFELPAWVHDPAAVKRYQAGGDLENAHVNRTLTHMALVHHQMRQLRCALLVAHALGRTLVMPDFTVLLDNTWYPMNGAWPGYRKFGPFVAPLDHVLHMTNLKTQNINYRSSTFLEHPKVKPTIGQGDVATVDFVDNAPVTVDKDGGRVTLPKGATQAQVVEGLKGHPAKVLHLSSTMDIVRGLDDPGEHQAFADRINKTPMLWCCITKNVATEFGQPFPPGHIYYDFWYDQEHRDRFGRKFSAQWDLRVGP